MDVIKRQPDPVHAPRRGRGRLGVGRADPPPLASPADTSRSATRPARPARPPPPCSSSVTAEPGRSPTSEHPALHPVIADVTEPGSSSAAAPAARRTSRRIRAAADTRPGARTDLACANLAHGFAASDAPRQAGAARAHQAQPRDRVQLQRHALGAPAVRRLPAGAEEGRRSAPAASPSSPAACPAMCDGITQGRDGMQLSLYSRDVIAMSTAIALSPRHVRRRADARRLRQDRARPADRRAVVRAPADGLRPGRADGRRACRTARRPGSASCTPRARSAARSCSRPRPRRTTRPARARSTAPPTPTSC